MGLRIVLVVTLVLTSGCRWIFGFHDVSPSGDVIDAPLDDATDAYIPDAGPCQTLGAQCAGPNTLRTCTMIGDQPVDTDCSWSCRTTPDAHCAKLVPSGGGVTPADLDPMTGLSPIAITSNASIDDSGAITNVRLTGPGLANGINFNVTNGIAIYNFDSLAIGPSVVVTFQGTHPIALAVRGDLVLTNAGLDATGSCNNENGGPGGGTGGNEQQPGNGGGGGGGLQLGGEASGGGGGGYGAVGGIGGKTSTTSNPPGGPVAGDATITKLAGGSGGGGGGGPTGGSGGGGGGGLQLVANGTITITGNINAGGCGGRHGGAGGNGGGGGGGGAGGTILIEAHDLVLQGKLAVNGGGGGGAKGGTSGDAGSIDGNRANGGTGAGGGSGGAGGASMILVGDPGQNSNVAGGGGGGVGRIRINTRSGTVMMLAGTTLSPTLTDTGTTTTIGQASTQ